MHFHIVKMYKDKEVKKCQGYGDVNVKNIFTSHIDKKISLTFFDFFIFIHFHYMKFVFQSRGCECT
jgi:hypothetical protein